MHSIIASIHNHGRTHVKPFRITCLFKAGQELFLSKSRSARVIVIARNVFKRSDMSDKFKLVAAAACNPGQIVIARADGDGMHGSDYMVINADKPHAPYVYAVLRHEFTIERFEEKFKEFLEGTDYQFFNKSERVAKLLNDYRTKRGVWYDNPPQTEQNGFTTDDMQKLVTKIKLDKQESGITDQQIIDKQINIYEYEQAIIMLRQQLDLANKTIEALTTLILTPKQQ